MTHSTPITASGSACSYTHQFKKHFGDRPVAFALSERSPSPSSRATRDPFAASSSSTTSSIASSSTLATPAQAVVDAETHNTLANLGWRIRSRINQGYTRTSTSLDDPTNAKFGSGNGGGFVSERDVLISVGNTRRGWSRVSTAPNVASNFDGLRVDTQPQQTIEPRMEATKRSRRLSEGEEEDIVEETMDAYTVEARRIAGLPKLSFSSSTSSISSQSSFFPPSPNHLAPSRSFVRSHSSKISPFTSATAERFADGRAEMDMDMDSDALVTAKRLDVGYDFSSHFDSTDF
ncbi:hypothetical protein PHSY_005319 [Pseudozyma hubeiensis SY62]|uniref:Uncharacterized protein n=1 Tax=Pseudozyma hubeiensis (strain SY62) TaxID=1305764 RepID=R9P8Z1_PSEHS|nr:hypothetical protein PHSY_005319 [Pseudozyma hubeiensis SY62]GAC97732.1 hypothetical protein PHSY_005319 [Pseudozyma hubeiensis SY62]